MAAAASGKGMAEAGCNFVGQDEIWKDHVYQETEAAKRWPDNWNFLTTKYEDLVKDEIPRKQRPKLEQPTAMKIKPGTPLEERLKVAPTPKSVPRTSAEFIGWRSTEKVCQLEKYGRYAPPKGGLVKQLNWPAEAI